MSHVPSNSEEFAAVTEEAHFYSKIPRDLLANECGQPGEQSLQHQIEMQWGPEGTALGVITGNRQPVE